MLLRNYFFKVCQIIRTELRQRMMVEQSFREGTLCLEEIVSSSRSEPDMLAGPIA